MIEADPPVEGAFLAIKFLLLAFVPGCYDVWSYVVSRMQTCVRYR
jgi:hypothetical protein